MIPRCQRGGPSSILGWRTFCLSLVYTVRRVDQVLKVGRELTVAQLVERGTVKVICSHPQVDGSIPSGEIFLFSIFTLYSDVLQKNTASSGVRTHAYIVESNLSRPP